MSVIAELSVFPLDQGESVGAFVARAVGVIRKSGLPHVLTPMGTCIEGEWEEVQAVVDACFRSVADGSGRVYLSLKVDWREGRTDGLRAKTASVERRLAAGEGA